MRPERGDAVTAGNGHVGVVDDGDPSGALLSARLMRRGHRVTRWVATPGGPIDGVDDRVADVVLGWPDAPGGWPDAVVPTGGRRPWRAVRRAAPAAPVLAAGATIDLDDELGLLLWLADHDMEVPRVLGRAEDPAELADRLPTDGPVIVAHARGEAVWPARRCRTRRDLDLALADAAASPTEGPWYLLEDVAGRDAVVAGVFRSGEPVVWGSFTVARDPLGRPVQLEADDGGRLLEIAEEIAGLVALDGPCELRFRIAGSEAHLAGLAPTVTWPLLALGAAADDALGSALARLGVPCADRPSGSPNAPAPRGPIVVAPTRALASSGFRRTARLWSDPWRPEPPLPGSYRRWAFAFGRRAASDAAGSS